MKPKVLVVDRDETAAAARDALEAMGCRVKTYPTGEKAVAALVSFKPDVLITDIALPGISGFALLEIVKAERAVQGTSVIVVASEPGRDVLARAFEAGAEDFLIKPYDVRELVARVEGVLRRSRRGPVCDSIRLGRLGLDPSGRRAHVDGEEVRLTSVEFGLLLLLVQKAGRALSRDYLLQYLWGSSEAQGTRTVDMHIANLRRKLGSLGELIETVKGIGYQFTP